MKNVYEPVNFRNSITTSLIFNLLLLDKVPFQDLRIANSVALNFVIGVNEERFILYLGIEDELVEMLDLVLLLEPLSLSIFKQMLVDSFGFKVDLIQRLKNNINIWTSKSFVTWLFLRWMSISLNRSFLWAAAVIASFFSFRAKSISALIVWKKS